VPRQAHNLDSCVSRRPGRYSSHGGLTPPAHDRVYGRHCRSAILAEESNSFPTGGLRPPLLVAPAAAVADGRFSPMRMIPVARNTGASPGSEAGFVRFSPIRAILFPRGAYAPARGDVTTTVCRRNGDFCDAQTHIHKSGGRQPAVGVSNAVAIANAFAQRHAPQPAGGCKPRLQRQCGEFGRFEYACGRYSTGGLRPPLLVAPADAVAEVRFSLTRAILFPRGAYAPRS
jgi:hypothetical protein